MAKLPKKESIPVTICGRVIRVHKLSLGNMLKSFLVESDRRFVLSQEGITPEELQALFTAITEQSSKFKLNLTRLL